MRKFNLSLFPRALRGLAEEGGFILSNSGDISFLGRMSGFPFEFTPFFQELEV